ncbi:hypothetical protein [Rufibacter aurantiacus]|uniref:hypothetical protein n=1 Tax=Rufibacter aurantiacus TaxID=2817374 RepID=UPI001B30E70A|nr:hypothetical protein [Rufibacter aurantiacus]
MIKNLRNYCFLLALSLFTMNCGSNEKEDPDPVVDSACYFTREVFTNPNTGQTRTRDFVYGNDRLEVINETTNLPAATTLNLVAEYDGQGRVSRTVTLQNGREMQYYTFEYDNQNLLRKINLYTDRNGNLGLNSSIELGYNAQKQIVTSKNYFLLGSAPLLTNDITYTYDANGNMIRSREYRVLSFRGAEVLSDVVINMQYTHDDKINPHYRVPYLMYTYPNSMATTLSKNNSVSVVSSTSTEGTQKGPGTSDMRPFNYSRTFTYTYSDKNWPLTRMGADGTSTSYAYICE